MYVCMHVCVYVASLITRSKEYALCPYRNITIPESGVRNHEKENIYVQRNYSFHPEKLARLLRCSMLAV